MNIHVLNGDCLFDQLPKSIPGEFIICRECLVEGPVVAENLNEFWKKRAGFIEESYGFSQEGYAEKSVKEFSKLESIPEDSEINLWFENDLFCQVNLWFIVHRLASLKKTSNVYWVRPLNLGWTVFGNLSEAELEKSLEQRVKLEENEIELFSSLWDNHCKSNFAGLAEIANKLSARFSELPKVIEAHVGRFASEGKPGKPEQIIAELVEKSGSKELKVIFNAFRPFNDVYGFGDLQVKRLLKRIIADNIE
jgi:hypothetical protein